MLLALIACPSRVLYGLVGESIFAEPRSRFPLGVQFARAESCNRLKLIVRAFSELAKSTIEPSVPSAPIGSLSICVRYVPVKCPYCMKYHPWGNQMIVNDSDLKAPRHLKSANVAPDRPSQVIESCRVERSACPAQAYRCKPG